MNVIEKVYGPSWRYVLDVLQQAASATFYERQLLNQSEYPSLVLLLASIRAKGAAAAAERTAQLENAYKTQCLSYLPIPYLAKYALLAAVTWDLPQVNGLYTFALRDLLYAPWKEIFTNEIDEEVSPW